MKALDWFHPITRRRLRRFFAIRRAAWSFAILTVAFVLSLGAELFCNSDPLYLRFEGRSYFPVFRFYSERLLLGSGPDTRMDYKALVRSERFSANSDNWALWPVVPFGPLEIVRAERVELPDEVVVRIAPDPRVASVNVTRELMVTRGVSAGFFFAGADGEEEGVLLPTVWTLPDTVRAGIERRFRNEASDAVSGLAHRRDGAEAEVSLSPFSPRRSEPKTVRLTFGEGTPRKAETRFSLTRELAPASGEWPALWERLDEASRERVLAAAAQRFDRMVDPVSVRVGDRPYRVRVEREDVRFPFRPVAGHPLGIDSAGRDVLARLIYGFRTSMSFGVLLVVASLLVGTLVGAAQGYYGGRFDLLGQRVIEVWDALPFLYILILVGSVYGRGFGLLLVCYALFNWIGISYYMRAEFLRLRGWTFVEAARAQGLPARLIMFRHILPNALVPLVTFFPFSLVSAIGVLAALDFLGFGLPPPTPSWGELLAQAQEYPWAWWLTLYPALALFVVMLFGVFIGEGVRQAFDPKPISRME
ncbi:MAG: ABC transporter permease subunit [Kiritimatiellae bacterium]|nr:ABC transporter permease subunit [Kiritimatiellia bacterium]MCO5062219.1 ABC transporter permease subunit [Kiritimatiellia bacterium]MCO5069025.1 ABC transporter permease subunit [Kiritimatiellia bacterium]